jgi:prepilin-type N-terminal cleavage/methylation domain-containing protein
MAMISLRCSRLRCSRSVAREQQGMTIIELMIAMVVLAVGILASMNLVAVAMATNARSRQQSNSTALAQMVTERIMAIPATSNAVLTITDCANPPFNVNTAAGGAPLAASGDVDFTQGTVANYNMPYTDCATQGRQAIYDVRWNVQQISNSAKLLTVSARLRGVGRSGLVYAPIVTIRTIVGLGT